MHLCADMDVDNTGAHMNAHDTKSNDKKNPIICMLCNNTSFDKPLSSQ